MFELPKVIAKRKKRLGRGPGSGKGRHTVGRGEKGQKTRRSIGILFEGYKTKKSLFKRLPMQRGKGKFKARSKPEIVKVDADLDTLIKKGLVNEKKARKYGFKILGKSKVHGKISV